MKIVDDVNVSTNHQNSQRIPSTHLDSKFHWNRDRMCVQRTVVLESTDQSSRPALRVMSTTEIVMTATGVLRLTPYDDGIRQTASTTVVWQESSSVGWSVCHGTGDCAINVILVSSCAVVVILKLINRVAGTSTSSTEGVLWRSHSCPFLLT